MSRETVVGEEAAKVLQEGGLNVVFHQLDIINPPSIETFVEWVKTDYGGIDILVTFLSAFNINLFFVFLMY
ncbi:carbonyl reductase [NADPH] 1 [Phtheirospermum japonicum]|uniref:Carbonyl reductase [NADPH] 1 n=1 Tax=Phtheirospermum japonicum TaxID=374723 RepID=A0A830B0W9_9LAMI|nr:carbonyl reductase [NADPH] 1 [Phtheirospermum japonicum]